MRARSTPLTKGVVLLVESDSTLQASVVAALQAEHYDVFLAANRRQAVALRASVPIDLLVLDMDVQAQDSWELLADLRRKGHHACSLVIVRSLEQLAWASDAGADAFLLKPLDVARMVSGVNHLLARTHAGVVARGSPPRNTAPFMEAPAFGCHWRINE